MTVNEEKIDFCVRFLLSNGVDSARFSDIADSLPKKKEVRFVILKQMDNAFFEEIAEGLRNMWPPGKKDDKWDWRESVPTLVERLSFIWNEMHLEDKYTVDQCLEMGRKYLARFQNTSTKYMMVLKYFIFKQKETGTKANGLIKKTYESTLVKMLQDNEWENIDSEMQVGGFLL